MIRELSQLQSWADQRTGGKMFADFKRFSGLGIVGNPKAFFNLCHKLVLLSDGLSGNGFRSKPRLQVDQNHALN